MVRETLLLQQLISQQDDNKSLAALTIGNGVKQNRYWFLRKCEVSVIVDFKPGSGSHESKKCALLQLCLAQLKIAHITSHIYICM